VFKIYYRGYILIRLKVIGTEWEVECKFTKLQELDKIVAYIRVDDDLSNWIEETTTLVSSKPNYPK